jgi:HSP20 family molecular chaperone IbpA
MIQDPMDMVTEMDELFDRLFSRLHREFAHGFSPDWEYRTSFDDEADPGGTTITAGPGLPSTPEPLTEVHTIGNEVKVVTELPGITDDEVRIRVRDNSLVIDAGDGDHHYHTTTALPAIDAASMQRTLKNGILEVTFTLLPVKTGRR